MITVGSNVYYEENNNGINDISLHRKIESMRIIFKLAKDDKKNYINLSDEVIKTLIRVLVKDMANYNFKTHSRNGKEFLKNIEQSLELLF